MPWQYRPFALTSGSLPVTRAGHCQDDPVSSCTDLNVTTLSAARPSYSPTWRRAGFLKGEGGALALGWVCFPRLSQLRLPRSAPAKMPGEERLGGRCAGTPAPAGATDLGRQAGQAPAELLPVSHRYTPSQRAPHFLYHLITPKGSVRQAHPLSHQPSLNSHGPDRHDPALSGAKAGGSPSASAKSYKSPGLQ